MPHFRTCAKPSVACTGYNQRVRYESYCNDGARVLVSWPNKIVRCFRAGYFPCTNAAAGDLPCTVQNEGVPSCTSFFTRTVVKYIKTQTHNKNSNIKSLVYGEITTPNGRKKVIFILFVNDCKYEVLARNVLSSGHTVL